MNRGKSLIDEFVSKIEDEPEDDWFEVVIDIISNHQQEPQSVLDTFNLYLYAKYGEEVKSKVVEVVKAKFASTQSKPGALLLNWDTFNRLRWQIIYRKQCLFACNELIKEEISRICEETDFTEPLIPQFEKWLTTKLFSFINKYLFMTSTSSSSSFPSSSSTPSVIQKELSVFATHTFVEIRAKSLFEIILDFPDSLCAVKEFRECVKDTSSLLGTVAQILRGILDRRLLHLGASTNQILDFYIAMIKVLRIIDASDVLLHFVSAPVRAYLKSRPDSIRCIISSLTETKDSDLHDELKIGTSLAYGVDEDDEEVVLANGALADWSPPTRMRVLTDTELLQHQSRGLDILATLVSIYGSTDLFIAEYRNLLSEKMLDNLTYATDAELVNVELMKIRFGEESLHHCEVMLRDVEDSKRTNTTIMNRAREAKDKLAEPSSASASTFVSSPVTDMLMVSEHYWPARDADKQQYDSQKLHPTLQRHIDDYNRRYHELKKPRVLSPWLTQTTVNLTLDFDDGASRSFKATLFQANLLHHITIHATASDDAAAAAEESSGQGGVSARQLSEWTEVEEEEVVNAMRFWLNKGVVRLVSPPNLPTSTTVVNSEDKENSITRVVTSVAAANNADRDGVRDGEMVYVVIEEQLSRMAEDSAQAETSFDQEFSSGAGGSGSAASDARIQAAKDFCETFVKGLLRSHGAMPLDRLQAMLTMMLRAAAENGGMQINKITLTTTDLAFVAQRAPFLSYLQGLVERSVIDIDNGMYCEHKR